MTGFLEADEARLAAEYRRGEPAAVSAVDSWVDAVLRRFPVLNEEDRRLVELVVSMHCSDAEVARELGVPEGTVTSRMSRCKERMRERFEALERPRRLRP